VHAHTHTHTHTSVTVELILTHIRTWHICYQPRSDIAEVMRQNRQIYPVKGGKNEVEQWIVRTEATRITRET